MGNRHPKTVVPWWSDRRLLRRASVVCDGMEAFYSDHPPIASEEPVHAHPEVSLELTLRGGYVGVMGRQRREFIAGRVEVLPAGELHTAVSQGMRTQIFCFRCEPGMFAPGVVGAYLDDDSAGKTALSAALFRIYRQMLVGDTAARLAIECEAAPVRQPQWSGGVPCRVADRARDLLHDTLDTPWALGEIAAEVGVNAGHLCRVFRERFGCSMGEYQRRLRLRRALVGLGSTDQPIAFIASAAGFSDQSHLGREMRRRLGVTPAQYRAMVGG